jgi:hypothetical protein
VKEIETITIQASRSFDVEILVREAFFWGSRREAPWICSEARSAEEIFLGFFSARSAVDLFRGAKRRGKFFRLLLSAKRRGFVQRREAPRKFF